MALQINTTTHFGVDLPAAYARVQSVQWIKGAESSVEVCIYANADCKGLAPATVRHYPFTISLASTENVVAQAYTFLKSLEAFAGALDV